MHVNLIFSAEATMTNNDDTDGYTRRALLISSAATVVAASIPLTSEAVAAAATAPEITPARWINVSLAVNGQPTSLLVDPRVTLLDALREHLDITGPKKGCDHGQCGACTIILNGKRINSCLTLVVMHQGDVVTTIEGLGTPANLHPMQAAFVDHDGYQCGFCTPGQICSAVGMLEEIRHGMPSDVTADLMSEPLLSNEELRERMSGNICRCAAYPNIVEAIQNMAGGRT
jgi:xanthine dehydrogenase YagT iron-sulfur-binding subunit